MGAFVLGSGFKLTFLFTILALLATAATLSMICIRKPISNKGSMTMSIDRVSVDRSTIEWMTEAELPIKINNTVDTSKDPLAEIPDVELVAEESFCNNVKVTYRMMISKRMRFYLLQCFWTGISIAYFSGLVTPIIVRQLPGVE